MDEKQSTKEAKENTINHEYFLPEYGRVVEAKSIDEAVKMVGGDITAEGADDENIG